MLTLHEHLKYRRERLLQRLVKGLRNNRQQLKELGACLEAITLPEKEEQVANLMDCSAELAAVQAAEEVIDELNIAIPTAATMLASLQSDLTIAEAWLDAAQAALEACQGQ